MKVCQPWPGLLAPYPEFTFAWTDSYGPVLTAFPGQMSPHVIDMLFVGFGGAIQPGQFYAANNQSHLITREHHRARLIEKTTQFRKANHTRPHVGLKLCCAGKRHYRNIMLIGKARKRLDSPDVSFILANWILKRSMPSVMNLRPFGVVGTAKNPSAVVLGFNDEYTSIGHDDVVNFSRAGARRQGNVVHQFVRAMKHALNGGGDNAPAMANAC